MVVNSVDIELDENGDYVLKLNHEAVENFTVSLSKVPKDKRGGAARALLSASALYCMAGSVNYILRANKVPVRDVKGSASIKMGKNEKGRDLVKSMSLDIKVDIPEENKPELDKCIKFLEDGCLVTRGLKKGIKVTNNIHGAFE
jgi:uncharacterized OsmC-like protein